MCVIIYILYNSILYKLYIRYYTMINKNKQVSKDKVSNSHNKSYCCVEHKKLNINQKPTDAGETLYTMKYSNKTIETYKLDVFGSMLGLGYTNDKGYSYYCISLFDLLKLLKNKKIEDTKNRLIDANNLKNGVNKALNTKIPLNKELSIKHKLLKNV